MKRLAVLVLIVTACGNSALADVGIDCDPMPYQYENEVWALIDGQETPLTEDAGVVEVNPSVSSDGRRIAFTSGPDEDLDLYVMEVDGSNRQLIWAGDTLQSAVDWSPDDSVLVFDQDTEEDGLQVMSIPVDGGEAPVQLTDGEPNGKPRWGTDDRILFLSLSDGEEQEVYSMNPDGSDPANLTNHPARDVLAEMSPDGTQIVFVSDRAGSGEFDIWLMESDGSNPRRLTHAPERDTNPTWSSDGRHIIFRSDRNPEGLWAMNPDGSDQIPVLRGGWLASCP